MLFFKCNQLVRDINYLPSLNVWILSVFHEVFNFLYLLMAGSCIGERTVVFSNNQRRGFENNKRDIH